MEKECQLEGFYYTRAQIAQMYGCSVTKLNYSIKNTEGLLHELVTLGFKPKRNLTKKMVLTIFKRMGAPVGYEQYETV